MMKYRRLCHSRRLAMRLVWAWLCIIAVAISGCASREIVGAVESGDLPAVKRLVKQDHRLVDTTVVGGYPSELSILQDAIAREHRELAKYLITVGADVDFRDSLGRTALHYAVEKRDARLAELLLRHRADTSAVDRLGNSALLEAVRQRDGSMARLLRQHGAEDVPLMDEAAALNELGNVRRMLKHNPHLVDAVDAEGWTPLHYAADRGNLGIAQHLIQSGARVLAKDKYGWTSLQLAARGGHLAVVRVLLPKGAVVTNRTREIDEALRSGVCSGSSDANEFSSLCISGSENV